MKALFRFIFSAETACYLRWRWRRQGLKSIQLLGEWLALLGTMGIRKVRRTPNASPTTSPQTTNFSDPDFIHYLLRPEQVMPLAATIKEKLPKEVQAMIQSADRMVADGKIALPTQATINLRTQGWRPRVNDQEHFFALHRWSFGVVLAKAWAYSEQERFAQTFGAFLESWIKANPPKADDPAWESYSVCERMVHWCFSTVLLWNAPHFRERIYPVLMEQLRLHADWLATHLEMEKIHNHLMNNGRALYIVGLFLNIPEHRALGWSLLERELERQVFPDGFLKEQSVPYHLLLTRTFIEVHLLTTRAQENASPLFTDRIRRMIEAAAAFIRLDESCPLIGDVSPDIALNDLVGSVAAGQIHFGLPQSVLLNEQGSWVAGMISKSASLPESQTVFLSDAGYMIHRSNDVHLVLHADPRAEVVRHGHADALGVCLWHKGREILRDSGNFSYRFNSWWSYFHGPEAHTGISLAGLPAYPLTDFLAPWYATEYRKASAGLEKPRQVGSWTCASGWHSGYSRLGNRLIVRRRLILGTEYLWMTDWIEGQNRQIFQARWNLPSGDNSTLSMLCLLDGHPEKVQWKKGWHSPAYGLKEPTSIAQIDGLHAKETTRLDLLIGWGKPAPLKLVITARDHETVESSAWTDIFDVMPDGSRFEARRESLETRV